MAGATTVIVAILTMSGKYNLTCNYYTEDYGYDDACALSTPAAVALGCIGGLCWIGTGTCTFIFACGQRYKKFHNEENRNDGLSNSTTTVSKIITHLPNGSIKTEVETILPNGKKTVTTTIKTPDESSGNEEEEEYGYVDKVQGRSPASADPENP